MGPYVLLVVVVFHSSMVAGLSLCSTVSPEEKNV